MAEVTGTICDVCGKMFHTTQKPADIRIVLSIHTSHDGHSGERNKFDICSNKCLKEFARMRLVDDPSTFVAKKTDEEIRAAKARGGAASSHARWHTDKEHANPNCVMCREEYGI